VCCCWESARFASACAPLVRRRRARHSIDFRPLASTSAHDRTAG
jgi:hypothetical protein